MNGPELIETLRQDILLDIAKPYLWRDEALYRMLSLGQRTFSEDTHCLEDVVEIVTEPDVATYPLDGTTLRVRAVGLSEQGPWLPLRCTEVIWVPRAPPSTTSRTTPRARLRFSPPLTKRRRCSSTVPGSPTATSPTRKNRRFLSDTTRRYCTSLHGGPCSRTTRTATTAPPLRATKSCTSRLCVMPSAATTTSE